MRPSLRFAAVLLAFSARVAFAADAPASSPPSDSAGADDVASLKQQLAETRDELATALHSFEVVQDENHQLKADAEKSAAQIDQDQQAITSLKAQVPPAGQVETLRLQVHELQDQSAALAAEVYHLKTELALASNPPAHP
jgi:chromosome segregation ATPase